MMILLPETAVSFDSKMAEPVSVRVWESKQVDRAVIFPTDGRIRVVSRKSRTKSKVSWLDVMDGIEVMESWRWSTYCDKIESTLGLKLKSIGSGPGASEFIAGTCFALRRKVLGLFGVNSGTESK